MKAIQFDRLGGPEVLELVEVPDPVPGPGQLLVKVASAAVNFSDIMRRKGEPYPEPTPLPFTPGAEIAGTVVALGDGVEGHSIGSTVFGISGATGEGGYAELALIPAVSAIPVPPGVSTDTAAGLVVVGLAAALILSEQGGLEAGETVFVPAAAGGLGAYAVQIAKLLGATVIAGAGTEEKRRIALGYGADHAVPYTGEGWTDRVRELTGGRGVDLALEMTDPSHLVETAEVLAPFGRVIAYGSAAGRDTAFDPRRLEALIYDSGDGRVIQGFDLLTWLSSRQQETFAALTRLIGWVAEGSVAGPTISAMPLARAADAQTLLETGRNRGKVVLNP